MMIKSPSEFVPPFPEPGSVVVVVLFPVPSVEVFVGRVGAKRRLSTSRMKFMTRDFFCDQNQFLAQRSGPAAP